MWLDIKIGRGEKERIAMYDSECVCILMGWDIDSGSMMAEEVYYQ